MPPTRSTSLVLLVLLLASPAPGCRRPTVAPPLIPHTSNAPGSCAVEGGGWSGGNGERLQRFVEGLDPEGRPVAIFDWDNTMIKNDVGAATVAYVIREGLVRRPASWGQVPWLTAAARAALQTACAGSELTLPTLERQDCARLLLGMYHQGTLPDGAAAFEGYDPHTYKPTAAWQNHLLAGHTPAEVRAIAERVIDEGCRAPVGRRVQLAGLEVDGYLRLYAPMVRLVERLRARGAQVWVLSASPQHVVEAFAARAGIDAERVIGVRSLLDDRGRLDYGFEGCGDVADGDNGLITYVEGKRCWAHKVIRRPAAFAAGDSQTDLSFLRDATGLRLVINRGYADLMCWAYDGVRRGDWLVNPMFVAPRPRRPTPFPCSSSACLQPDGSRGPCRRADGTVLEDQADGVVPD